MSTDYKAKVLALLKDVFLDGLESGIATGLYAQGLEEGEVEGAATRLREATEGDPIAMLAIEQACQARVGLP